MIVLLKKISRNHNSTNLTTSLRTIWSEQPDPVVTANPKLIKPAYRCLDLLDEAAVAERFTPGGHDCDCIRPQAGLQFDCIVDGLRERQFVTPGCAGFFCPFIHDREQSMPCYDGLNIALHSEDRAINRLRLQSAQE